MAPSSRKIKTTPKTAAQAKADKYITPAGKKPSRKKIDAEPARKPSSGFELFSSILAKPDTPILPDKPKMGRPTIFTEELAAYIEESLIEGKSMLKICSEDGMPNRVTVMRWCNANPAFAERITRAREEQADLMDDLIYETANNSTGETAASDRVKLQAYSWRAEHLKPRKYGKHVNMEQTSLVATANVDILGQLNSDERGKLREIISAARERANAAEVAERTRQPKQIEGKVKRRA